MKKILWIALLFVVSAASAADRVQFRLDTSEADAVLGILDKRAAGTPVTDADWQKLFNSPPYVRLKKREASLHRDFSDEDFKRFVLSLDLAKRAPLLHRTLDA